MADEDDKDRRPPRGDKPRFGGAKPFGEKRARAGSKRVRGNVSARPARKGGRAPRVAKSLRDLVRRRSSRNGLRGALVRGRRGTGISRVSALRCPPLPCRASPPQG